MSGQEKQVYLDYAATTPVDERVLQAMLPYFRTQFGNPSSLYCYGRAARQAVAKARRQVSALLHATPEEIFFTSGGSESDNWAVKCMALAARRERGRNHIITTTIEHHAVLRTCAWLAQQDFEVTYLPMDAEGCVTAAQVEAALREDTALVSVMFANNEVGTIEPIAEIGAMLREHGVFFHTDAVQAAGHIPIDLQQLPVDALSLSGHKLYGPKGTGVLYLRRGWQPDSLMHGGAQESEQRAGTENVPGIVGLGFAAELAQADMTAEQERLTKLREQLLAGIRVLPGAAINGSLNRRLPGNVNFRIAGIDHEVLLIRLDLAGFAVSAGSACSAGSLEPSHVLLAMGQTAVQASEAVRVTLGRYTTAEEIAAFLQTLNRIVKELKA